MVIPQTDSNRINRDIARRKKRVRLHRYVFHRFQDGRIKDLKDVHVAVPGQNPDQCCKATTIARTEAVHRSFAELAVQTPQIVYRIIF